MCRCNYTGIENKARGGVALAVVHPWLLGGGTMGGKSRRGADAEQGQSSTFASPIAMPGTVWMSIRVAISAGKGEGVVEGEGVGERESETR